ncbi:hypothetical protein [Metabacillus fastidiosus]|uniref:hypothetical protein n=1 Tax=Metabacillus fastidiosus TaxID=1458 RepID=UPI002DB63501|nr:hypothetical protein [Metabacillus fastidiosus]MEC2078514.1 hypothetical protein [Metabacillus fastidiosus]
MNFTFSEKYESYVSEGTIQLRIPKHLFHTQFIEQAEIIAQSYEQKLNELAAFCLADPSFSKCYPEQTVHSISEQLGEPIVYIDQAGGVLTYTQHTLDRDHIIDIEFVGALESFFSVSIDG